MKQLEITKKDQINKLKRELETVEERFQKIVNQTEMVGEDFRSQACRNIQKFFIKDLDFKELERQFDEMKSMKEALEIEK